MLSLRPARIVTAAVAASVIALVGTALAVASPADAVSGGYVALGDSYSSGVGAGDYTSESGNCDRSTNAYSALWSKANSPSSYVSVACSGATTTSVTRTQLSALSGTTGLVSIIVGGNDVGFSSIMETCVVKGTSDCVAAVTNAESKARTQLPGALGSLYSSISAAAPNARVVVLDYPVFYDTSKSGCIGLSGTSRAKIDEGINLVDGIIQAAAAGHGFIFGDVRSAFSGHQICDDSRWLHSLNFFDITESYHPTADGQADGYLPVFSSAVS